MTQLQVHCPQCDAVLSLRKKQVSEVVTCPECNGTISIARPVAAPTEFPKLLAWSAIILNLVFLAVFGGWVLWSENSRPVGDSGTGVDEVDNSDSVVGTGQSVETGNRPGRIVERQYYRKTWGVIIGIDKYRHDFAELRNAVNDARAVHAMLRDEFGYQDDEELNDWDDHLLVLLDDRASRKQVEFAVTRWLGAKDIREDDAVLFYFSGHGGIEDGEGFLAGADTHKQELKQTGISVAWLRDRLSELRALHKAIILDCCSSGSLFSSVPVRRDAIPEVEPMASAPQSQPRGEGVVALSTQLSQPAFLGLTASRLSAATDNGQGHSLFTGHLLKVMENRANSERDDHVFTFRKMAALVAERVQNAKESYQSPQFGYLTPSSGDFLFRPAGRRRTISREESELDRYNTQLGRVRSIVDKRPEEAFRLLSDRSVCPEHLREITWTLLRWHCTDDSVTLAKSRSGVTALAFSPDGKTIAGTDKTNINLWDTATGELLVSRANTYSGAFYQSLRFSMDGDHVFHCTRGELSEWNSRTLEKERVSPLLSDSHGYPKLTHKEDCFILHTAERGLHSYRIFNTTTEQYWSVRSNGLENQDVELTRDGTRLFVLYMDSPGAEVRMIDLATGKTLMRIEPNRRRVRAMAITPDGSMMATAGADGDIEVWDVSSEFQLKVAFPTEGRPLSMRPLRPRLAFSEDGTRLAIGVEDRIIIRSLHRQAPSAILKPNDRSAWPLHRKADFFSDRDKRDWAAKNVVFLNDRELAATFADWVVTWDLTTFEETSNRQLIGGKGISECVSLKKQYRARRMGSAMSELVSVTDMRTGKLIASLQPLGVFMQFSEDGDKFASAGGGNLRVWNVETGRLLNTLKGHFGIRCFGFSADRTIAAGGLDTNIHLWDADTGDFVRLLPNHTQPVVAVAFSADGRTMASSSSDGEIILWDPRTGMARLTIDAKSPVHSLAFSPNGRQLAAGSTASVLVFPGK